MKRIEKPILIEGRASEDELKWIKKNMPKGMLPMVMERTGKTRMQVLYQLLQYPENQDQDIVTAFREILYVVTAKKYEVL